ncbi:helix-turn-helix transcriptional regulator [Negativicoccus succinicivorans]|uniref:helix-turn-helix domain-containing protein n=1 Tax=Negativicoccus succinicivorans TaxID=620903 RepID=UPI002903F6ED|nr:helix-turn-helix transcriptional regulator [Negativicoccus succinicivorans]MDU2418357.1 helix-turn-helix transcriptional regulator [Negativicoccus succinicivorans]
MEVKDILKARRLRLGLTLEDVAAKVGVSAATISRWESGDIANMRRDRIVALSSALQISPAVIMGWDETDDDENYYHDPEAAALADMIKDNPRYRVLFEASRNLSADDVDFVIDMINKLAKTDEDFIE